MDTYSRSRRILLPLLLVAGLLAGLGPVGDALAQDPVAGPSVTVSLDGADDGQFGLTIQIVLLMTVLTLAPAIIMLTTSFTRILIVLSFLRQAIGTPQMPNNQILIGLSLFLTVVVMMPIGEEIKTNAIDPYLAKSISQEEALEAAVDPVRRFMVAHTREKDLELFMGLTKTEVPESRFDLPLSVVVPSFLTSELKTAFMMGFLLYIPFLIVDMVVASVLMSMGMMMLPPILISLPFKVLLFVLVDGWHLITRSLVAAFAV